VPVQARPQTDSPGSALAAVAAWLDAVLAWLGAVAARLASVAPGCPNHSGSMKPALSAGRLAEAA